MPRYRSDHGPFECAEVANRFAGVRPSVKALLDLVDTSDPAWPAIAAVLREFTEAGVELDEATVAAAIKVGRQRCAFITQPDDFTQSPLVTATGSIVYYIRRGDLIKIGTTINPRNRFAALMPDEILAVEPGDGSLETARHNQFNDLRVRPRSEYFHDAPELQEHIKGILAMYGEPDTSWPNVAPRPSRSSQLPLVAENPDDVLTAIEAERELGIKHDTVYAWVARKRIQPVGRNDQNIQVFNRDHLIRLRSAGRRFVARY